YVDRDEWQHEPDNLQQSNSGDKSLSLKRAEAVADYLIRTLNVLDPISVVGLGLGSGLDFTVHDKERRIVIFRLAQSYIPGEHGFRFFPTFYRNLRDTMKRTPLPVDDIEPFVETFRTVFDNLGPAPEQAVFMYPPTPQYVLPRRRVTSLQEFFDLL